MLSYLSSRLRHALILSALWSLALAAFAAGGTVFWIAPRTNITMDRQVTEEVGRNAELVMINASWQHPDPDYTLAAITRRIKETSQVPVLVSAWAHRHAPVGRSEADLLKGLVIGTPVVQMDAPGIGKISFLDVTQPDVRSRVVERFVAAKSRLGVDGFALDLSNRTPIRGPIGKLCRQEAKLCPDYAKGMDALFGELRRALGDKTYLAYNGLFNFAPGQLEDQIRLLDNTNAAAIEYFGLNPNEREHSFSKDILPYLKAMEKLPADRVVLAFGRGLWKYSDYLEEYRWQRYLYGSFLLAARGNDLFKYHASFQVPAHQGRTGGLDRFAEWRLRIGNAKGPATFSGGLYRREFDEARVLVAPDDGSGGAINLQRGFYTPEGQPIEGELRLAPGTAMILLRKPDLALSRPARKVTTAKDIAAWKWSGAKLVGGSVELQPLAPEMTGEHDLLLDAERSLTPYERLEIDARPLSDSAVILAVAEVDDAKREYDSVVLEIGAKAGSRQLRLQEPVPFRSTYPEKKASMWPVLPIGGLPASGPLVIDGSKALAGTNYRFRRWSHVRFVGDVSVSQVALSQPQPPLALTAPR